MIPNINQIIARLRTLDDRPQNPQLQNFAIANKNNPFLFPLAVAESTMRKEMRDEAQARRVQGPKINVADQAIMAMGPQPQATGVAGLQAPNINIPDGGIAGYADGGDVVMSPGSTPSYQRTAMSPGMLDFAQRSEPVIRMAGGGVPRYQAGRMVIDPAVQTQRDKEAVQILLAELQTAKDLAAKGDPRAQADVAALEREIQGRIKRNPSLADVLTAAIPISSAQAAKPAPAAQPAAPVSGQIPGQTVQAPPAVQEEPGFFSRVGTNLGMSEDTKRQIANTLMATSGAMGASYIPAYTKVPGQISGLEALGSRIYNFINPQKGVVSAQEIAAMQKAADTARTGQAVRDAVRVAQEGGATVEEATALADLARRTQASERAARAAQVPSAAQRIQNASLAREATDAARLTQAGRAAQTAGQATAYSAMADQAAAAKNAAAPEQASYSNEGRNYPAPIKREDATKDEKKTALDTAKDAIPKKERKGFTDDDLIEIGLRMMADPGTTGIPVLSALTGSAGRAGLGALAARREREKAAREEAKELSEEKYRAALTRKAEAEAGVYESGTKGSQAALNAANTAFKNWESGLSALEKMSLTPEQRNAKYDEFLRKSFMALGLTVPAELSSSQAAMPAVPQGVKVRQIGG